MAQGDYDFKWKCTDCQVSPDELPEDAYDVEIDVADDSMNHLPTFDPWVPEIYSQVSDPSILHSPLVSNSQDAINN